MENEGGEIDKNESCVRPVCLKEQSCHPKSLACEVGMRRAWFEGAMTLVLGFVEFKMALSYLSVEL